MSPTPEIARFVEGLPRRYLQLFSPTPSTGTCGCRATSSPTTSTPTLERKGAAWELTVVTLDKPFLFSNICGVLSSFGMDILRGHAMTNPNGLVLDIFQFTDHGTVPRAERRADRTRLLAALEEVGRRPHRRRRRGCAAREQSVPASRRRRHRDRRRSIHCDNQSSRRYTILDIIADNALGLLHRISRVISTHGLRRRSRADLDRRRRRPSTCSTSPRRAPSCPIEAQRRADRRSASDAGGHDEAD